jgi:hypothetical protein
LEEVRKRFSYSRRDAETAEAKLTGDVSVYRRHLEQIEEELQFWPDGGKRRLSLLISKKVTLYRLGELDAGNSVNMEIEPIVRRLRAEGFFGPKGTKYNP